MGWRFSAVLGSVALLSMPITSLGVGTLTNLANFSPFGIGVGSCGLAFDSHHNIYGCTTQEGNGGTPYVYTGSGNLTPLFGSGIYGGYPLTFTAGADGNFYGTTEFGGAFSLGSIFKVAPATNSVTTLTSYINNQIDPNSLLIDAKGNIWGTTYLGGTNNKGTIFQMSPGATVTQPAAFFGDTFVANPVSHLVSDANGNIFGASYAGGFFGNGAIWELPANSGTIHLLASFNGSNGDKPNATLIVGKDGNFYGTTDSGGPGGYGVVYKFATRTNQLSVVASFDRSNGAQPDNLISDSAGDLWGETNFGGSDDDGTLFEILPGGTAAMKMFDFNNTTGAKPLLGLLADDTGNLYGVTGNYGPGGYGSLFMLSGTGFIVPEPSGMGAIFGVLIATLAQRRSRRKAGI